MKPSSNWFPTKNFKPASTNCFNPKARTPAPSPNLISISPPDRFNTPACAVTHFLPKPITFITHNINQSTDEP